jgi:hypothetical protein
VELDSAVVAGGAVAAVSGIGVGGQNGRDSAARSSPTVWVVAAGSTRDRTAAVAGLSSTSVASLIARAFGRSIVPSLQFGQRVGQLRGQSGGEVQPRTRSAAGKVQYWGDLVGGKLIQVGGLTQAGESG